ncbi:hypothetical protein FACS189432_03320 [Bacteroidia bacterium]|nr:hypothetical protein FACS189426_12350 [Bacteroidia bacterium]GHT27239.1 hypothetical protein FACS189432_03320 [Bacteroidia bacterium]
MEHEVFRSYITEYYDYDKLDLEISNTGNILIVGVGQKAACSYKSTGEKKELFDNLCLIHNDINYNQKRDFIAVPNWGINFKGDVVSIDIISNKDFDEQHLANSSLNNIIRFMSTSLSKYFIGGYNSLFDWDSDIPENFINNGLNLYSKGKNEYHPIDVKLSESIPSDFVLAELVTFRVVGVLSFEQSPTLSKEHELTVTIKVNDGRVFTPTITKIFE